jgi:Protein kinase domain
METPRKLSAVEVRVLSRLLERAQTMTASELEPWLDSLPEAQQVLVPRLRERLSQISVPVEDPSTIVPVKLTPKKNPDSRIGERVGPFRLVQELGTPGSGTLWLAERADGGKAPQVALMLPADEASAERQLVSLPEHPQVVRLKYAGVDDRGRSFRVMQRVEGVTLIEHVARRRLNAAQCVQILMPVLAAVAHAHGERVAHGDIRPATLRVDDDGHVFLLDWGMGRLLYPATATADMQALARVLEQMLKDTSPGADLKAVLQRALQDDPRERYEGVAPLMADLQRVLDHRAVAGPHATALHRGQLFVRRNRLALAGGALGVLVLGTAITLGVRHFQRGQQQVERTSQAHDYVVQAMGEDPAALAAAAAASAAPPDAALLAPRLQRTLEQARIGFDGEPVLRGQVITELALRFRDIGQPEQAQAVLREAVALLQSTAAASDPALAHARAELALLLVESRATGAREQAKALIDKVLAECSGARCEPAHQQAKLALQKLLAPAPR